MIEPKECQPERFTAETIEAMAVNAAARDAADPERWQIPRDMLDMLRRGGMREDHIKEAEACAGEMVAAFMASEANGMALPPVGILKPVVVFDDEGGKGDE